MTQLIIGSKSHKLSFSKLSNPGSEIREFGEFSVQAKIGAFSGAANCWLDRRDFVFLLNDLKQMNRTLNGEHIFKPIEEQVCFKISLQALGGINIEGELQEKAGGWGQLIKFQFGSDQTMLGPLIKEL